MNDLTVKLSSLSSFEKSKRLALAVVRGEFVDRMTDLYRSVCSQDQLPQLPVQPLRLSGDDEHLWIGLAP